MSDKIPLILLPGLLCDAALWEPQLAGLDDLADFFIADLTRQESLADMAAAVLRDAPWKKFALAGLSMGGYVAQEIMHQKWQHAIGHRREAAAALRQGHQLPASHGFRG